MTTPLAFVLFIIAIGLIFDFANGWHDAANSIATVVSTRVLSPGIAVVWAAAFNFIAFAVFGTRVAKTIAFLKSLDRKSFAGSEGKEVVLKFPNTTFEFNGADYVGKFVLPNVYFHITTAYGILRNRGVALGKPDYLGGGGH